MKGNRLIIFVKNEEAGKVKTRLARSIGDDKALEVYQKLLGYTYEITRGLPVEKEAWYSRFIPENDIWSGRYLVKKCNPVKTWERMSGAFQKAFEEEADKVVIIGSDCAELTSEIIEKAFEELGSSEFVIGPAQDGGYYLLGMRNFHPEVFQEIDWSTGSVYKQTIRKMENALGSISTLEMLNDVDTIEDWCQIKSKILNG